MNATRWKPSGWRRFGSIGGARVVRPPVRHGAHGQVLVLVVLGMLGLIAMVAIVIDGGNAWVQQRGTQNGTDAAAEAGAVVLVQRLAGAPLPSGYTSWDADVANAISGALSQNSTQLVSAYYTDVNGNVLTATGSTQAAAVGSGTIPTGAAGVQVQGNRTFSTYFAGVIGLTHMTTPASATAVAGILASATGFLPVTFPVAIATCAGNGSLVPGQTPWPIVGPPATPSPYNEAIVPLCKNGPGAVGWLDLGSGTLSDQISSPTTQTFTLPTWLPTNPGNPNSLDVQSALNKYDGQVVLLPMFDGTCKDEPSGTSLSDCSSPGVGNNTWYHIPQFTGFLLDHAYTSGNNFPACNSAPGGPPAGGNGSNGCLKGWFVSRITSGEVVAGGGNSGNPALGVQLIK
jgi:Flp pilus assembly protein TadG